MSFKNDLLKDYGNLNFEKIDKVKVPGLDLDSKEPKEKSHDEKQGEMVEELK